MRHFNIAVYFDWNYYRTDYYTVIAESRQAALDLLQKKIGKGFRVRAVEERALEKYDKPNTVECANW